jgi:hypothetical protein
MTSMRPTPDGYGSPSHLEVSGVANGQRFNLIVPDASKLSLRSSSATLPKLRAR